MKILLILGVSMLSFHAKAQCTIPNGSFDDFYEHQFGLSPTYLLPVDWTETVLVNQWTRAFSADLVSCTNMKALMRMDMR